MTQLDLKCAEAAKDLAQIEDVDEKLINSALGVLQEQGVYACFLYLRAQGKEHAKKVSQKLYEFLKDTVGLESNPDNVLKPVGGLSKDLDQLLFARELLLQVLMYARYHIKAKPGGSL